MTAEEAAALFTVRALHQPIVMFQVAGLEEYGAWDSREAALEWASDGVEPGQEAPEPTLTTFRICAECARLERDVMQQHEVDQWGYLNALWPCRTATAGGWGDA